MRFPAERAEEGMQVGVCADGEIRTAALPDPSYAEYRVNLPW